MKRKKMFGGGRGLVGLGRGALVQLPNQTSRDYSRQSGLKNFRIYRKTVSTLSRISLTKALVLWWWDNKKMIWTAERNICASLPNLQDFYISSMRKKAKKITLDTTRPAHSLFELLPFCSAIQNIFLTQAIFILNNCKKFWTIHCQS